MEIITPNQIYSFRIFVQRSIETYSEDFPDSAHILIFKGSGRLFYAPGAQQTNYGLVL